MNPAAAVAEEQEREARASATVVGYLGSTGYASLAHACEDLGYEPGELWAQIMEEAGLLGYEMPETIQVGWGH